jgi:hypothetical protein
MKRGNLRQRPIGHGHNISTAWHGVVYPRDMDEIYIGCWLSNLIIPNDPSTVTLNTSAGTWEIRKNSRFDEFKRAVCSDGQCAETYSAEGRATYVGSRSAAMDSLFDELVPLCLGSSYLTGLSVAPTRGLPASQINFVQVGDHFPRQRSMGGGFPIPTSDSDFVTMLERFMTSFSSVGMTEKARLLCHHWLDALAFWSLEDLILSTGTVLEVIAATAKNTAPPGSNVGTFNDKVAYAAQRFGIGALPQDFRKMRNDLVHEGVLSASNFPNKDRAACGAAAAEALDWIDEYIFAALGLGQVPSARFALKGFRGANSFSL